MAQSPLLACFCELAQPRDSLLLKFTDREVMDGGAQAPPSTAGS